MIGAEGIDDSVAANGNEPKRHNSTKGEIV
jgi:hypothetical protein